MDALSDLLRTINLSGVIFLRADLGERYGLAIPPPTLFHPLVKPHSARHRLVMFHIVREGSGYFEVEGFPVERLYQGDLIIIIDELTHSVVDTPGRETFPDTAVVPEHNILAAPPAAYIGEGERTMRLLCGMLQFEDSGFNPAFAALPPYLLIRREDGPEASWLDSNLSHIIREAESGRPGSETLLSRLTELLFVETLRSYFERLPEGEKGWFAALRDPNVGKALTLIHEDPSRRWTVAELAKQSGASRSALSAKFADLLGMPPLTYVTKWRLRVAQGLLTEPGASVQSVASRVGYESESAFQRAFKRDVGSPPAAWRKQMLKDR